MGAGQMNGYPRASGPGAMLRGQRPQGDLQELRPAEKQRKGAGPRGEAGTREGRGRPNSADGANQRGDHGKVKKGPQATTERAAAAASDRPSCSAEEADRRYLQGHYNRSTRGHNQKPTTVDIGQVSRFTLLLLSTGGHPRSLMVEAQGHPVGRVPVSKTPVDSGDSAVPLNTQYTHTYTYLPLPPSRSYLLALVTQHFATYLAAW